MEPLRHAEVTARLAAAGCVAAAQEATELVSAARDASQLDAWVLRRAEGEPLPWITGRIAFGGRRLHIAPGAYVPRPQSEELARRAARALPPRGRAVDLCTGIGAVAASLLAHDPSALVVGTDIDSRAATCARRNGVPVVVADLADAIAGDGTWDVVTAVAPYVPTGQLRLLPADVQRYEPRAALDGGPDGLHALRGVVEAGRRLLRADGLLTVEVGGHQDEILGSLAGFRARELWYDADGDLRGIALRRT